MQTYNKSDSATYSPELKREFGNLQRQLRVDTNDRILGRTAAGTTVIEEIPCTAAGRALLDDADAAAQRTTLGLGTAAVENYTTGNWTPTDASGAALTLTNPSGRYWRIGDLVIAEAALAYPVTADASNAVIGNLPFTVFNSTTGRGGSISYCTETTARYALPNSNATTVSITDSAGAAITNATMSGDTLFFTAIYRAA